VGAISQIMGSLGPMRLAIIGMLGVAVIAFFVFLVVRLSTPQMSLLYADLSSEDSSRIANHLDSQKIPFTLDKGGAEILVPTDKVTGVRLAVAEQGLPTGGSIGYEIFDKTESLGATNFVQRVRLVRALEGEISKTIRGIDGVRSARVHLVLPRRELFSRERQEPSAAVILNMGSSTRLSRQQVQAVQHLVAAAVPSLTPARISIVDDKGSLLARGFEDTDSAGAMAAKSAEQRRGVEKRISKTIEDLLEKSVGFGNVRAEVTAEMDFDRVSTNEENYDPDGQVVRSTQSVERTSSSREADEPPVSVGTNLPDASTEGGDVASATSAESSTEETVNFEISKKVVNHVRESGVMRRLSVAVLIDGSYRENEETGDREYVARTQEEMELLATLVRTAVGFNGDRGDSVEVINMRFAEGEEPEPDEPLELFFGFDKNDLLRIAEVLVLGIVGLLVILLVVRPLASRAFEALPGAAEALSEAQLLAEQAAEPALTGPGDRPPEEEGLEELIDIDRVEGRVKASSVKKVGEIVEKHPEEALSIVRAWMYQEA
jgi:flagellar M-ring protein FliF